MTHTVWLKQPKPLNTKTKPVRNDSYAWNTSTYMCMHMHGGKGVHRHTHAHAHNHTHTHIHMHEWMDVCTNTQSGTQTHTPLTREWQPFVLSSVPVRGKNNITMRGLEGYCEILSAAEGPYKDTKPEDMMEWWNFQLEKTDEFQKRCRNSVQYVTVWT